jgi:hypothetical protein
MDNTRHILDACTSISKFFNDRYGDLFLSWQNIARLRVDDPVRSYFSLDKNKNLQEGFEKTSDLAIKRVDRNETTLKMQSVKRKGTIILIENSEREKINKDPYSRPSKTYYVAYNTSKFNLNREILIDYKEYNYNSQKKVLSFLNTIDISEGFVKFFHYAVLLNLKYLGNYDAESKDTKEDWALACWLYMIDFEELLGSVIVEETFDRYLSLRVGEFNDDKKACELTKIWARDNKLFEISEETIKDILPWKWAEPKDHIIDIVHMILEKGDYVEWKQRFASRSKEKMEKLSVFQKSRSTPARGDNALDRFNKNYRSHFWVYEHEYHKSREDILQIVDSLRDDWGGLVLFLMDERYCLMQFGVIPNSAYVFLTKTTIFSNVNNLFGRVGKPKKFRKITI